MGDNSTSAASDVQRTDPQTLTNFILNQQHLKAPQARGHLSILLNAIAVSCKFVESAVRKAGLAGLLGMAGSSNVQGEDQKKLDVLANEVFINVLRNCGQCAVLVSEENDDPIFIDEQHRGNYCVVFDPLDGSSNIDCGVSIGTIFGIYPMRPGSQGSVEDVLRPGTEMVAAGYCLYGSSCMMVLGINNGVSVFTLDPSLGEFVLTSLNVQMPLKGSIFSVNEGNESLWEEPTKRCVEECQASKYVKECKYPSKGNKPQSLRYVGSMVADVHRTLLYGGSFLYPADKKSAKGKLRLLYECFPMAYLIEQAGGIATTGQERVLSIQPSSIHERCPIFLGSKQDVQRIEAIHKECS
ncbi:hypothetical protein WJX72_005853 [[Myrmecia] bisecta]|uniref:Fructose-1,6-bisphosphatase, cytosolic n=1 Tax=[Myrmecia] bisecta TaxID=41462 RepID=A0AAW1R730_9CHLO